MKTATLIILLLFTCLIGYSQTKKNGLIFNSKPMTDSVWKGMPDSIRNKTAKLLQISRSTNFFNIDAVDTVKCWFKEVEITYTPIITYKGVFFMGGDSSVRETPFQPGYYIVSKYYPIGFYFQHKMVDLDILDFLYADRKTIVKNHVTDHFKTEKP